MLLDDFLREDFINRSAKFKDLKDHVDGLEIVWKTDCLVWCNGHLPSFTPTSPTPLSYKNERNWQLKRTQEQAQTIILISIH